MVNLPEEAKRKYVKPDYGMCDGFGRSIDGEQYWYNTGLSQASIDEIKLYKQRQRSSTVLIGVPEKPLEA